MKTREASLATRDNPFRANVALALEQASLFASLLALSATIAAGFEGPAPLWIGVGVIAGLSVFYSILASRRQREWLLYAALASLVGSYVYYRVFVSLSVYLDVTLLAVFCCLLFGFSEYFETRARPLYARSALNFSLFLGSIAPLYALARRELDDPSLSLVSFSALFFSAVSYRRHWKNSGYLAGVLYNVVLWMWWIRTGWRIADHPQFYLVPVGFSAILFAEVNRGQLGVQNLNTIRSAGSLVVALSTAVPIWQFQSFGSWLFLLLGSLAGVFAGIALRVQTFVWMGLFFFLGDVGYQLFEVGREYQLAKWAIMVGLGIMLLVFVALNERKQIGATLLAKFQEVREWE